MLEADAYMLLARSAIPMARYPHELREWWTLESKNRPRYGLSTEQSDELVALCKARVQAIADEAEDVAVA